MTDYKAFVFDPDTCLEQELMPNITLCPTASADELCESVSNEHADLVVLHLTYPEGLSGLELVKRLRKRRPGIPALVVTTEDPDEQVWISASKEPSLELMHSPFTAGKSQYHLSRLIKQTKPKPLFAQPVEELRNDKGRLDANKVCTVFDLSMTDLANSLQLKRQTLSKTPDSLNLQSVLYHFERIARSLITVTGSIKGLKMWLHSPNNMFDEHTPMEFIKLGKSDMLADWIDDARLGSPD